MQLNRLKSNVDYEKEKEEKCRNNGWSYTPSRCKWEDIDDYEEYKAEIEKNGDKNLLVMVKLNGFANKYGVYPFARRHVYRKFGEYFLIHKTKNGAELLIRESEAEIVNK